MERLLSILRSAEARLASVHRTYGSSFDLTLLATIIVLAFVLLPFGPPFEVEEAYLAQAHKYVYPDAYGPCSSVIPFTNRKVAFDVPFGLLVEVLGFRGTQILGRLLLIAGYAFALTRLARAVNAGWLGLVLALSVFICGFNQAIFAREHIFRGVEPKAFAYIFVILAICDVVRGNKGWRPALFLAVGFYLHFLVAGWWALFCGLAILAAGRSMGGAGEAVGEAVRLAFRTGILVVPLIASIAIERLPDANPGPPLEKSDNWVYSIYGNPFHVAPFSDPELLKTFLEGYFLVPPIILVCWFIMLSNQDPVARRLSMLVAISMLWLMTAFLLDFLFNKDGALGKFYIYRPNSLALLLFLTFVSARLQEFLWKVELTKWLFVGLAAYACAALCLWMTAFDFYRFQKDGERSAKASGAVAFIAKNSARDSVVLLSDSFDAFLRERQVDRPTLVNYQDIPDRPGQLREWYRRIVFRQQVFQGLCDTQSAYPIRLALIWREKDLMGGASPNRPSSRPPNRATIDGAPCWTRVYEDQFTIIYEPTGAR